MMGQRANWLGPVSILAGVLVISAFHYTTSTEQRYLHEIYQRLYYVPILLAAFWYGPAGGVCTALLTSGLYLYHIQRDWHHFPMYTFNQYAEIFLYHAIGLLVGVLSSRERRQRRDLERTSRRLSEAYESLQKTFEHLRQADRLASMGQLSAGIAHEIRNPLGTIKGSIEILSARFPLRSSQAGISQASSTRRSPGSMPSWRTFSGSEGRPNRQFSRRRSESSSIRRSPCCRSRRGTPRSGFRIVDDLSGSPGAHGSRPDPAGHAERHAQRSGGHARRRTAGGRGSSGHRRMPAGGH